MAVSDVALVAVLYGLRQVRPRGKEALACDGLRVYHRCSAALALALALVAVLQF